ncbi:MAG: ATP-dependent carboligase [Candidatus Syntrophoarchaeum caldarius]|uniref:ATP-dependent carboligase n=1 Tax=Candidatus Syntropharchaeum caldarium TaxID=1838285 RepID=A0A1F2P8H1_9EURY|nr:MAG: ATP-dependent carboligase [Candidatus Syntrophoarchaeum caldarius]
MEEVLIVGYTTRQIAQSAVNAGFRVFCLDHFLDLDLLEIVEASALLDEDAKDFGVGAFLDRLDREIDGIIIGSGCEGIRLDERLSRRVIGNSPALMQKVSDKKYFGKKVIEMGFLHPEIYDRDTIRFPAVLKPRRGGGGLKNIFIRERSELEALDIDSSEYLIQQYINGIPASVSVISNPDGEVSSYCVNEQLIGIEWLNAPSRFAYCGNIIPLETALEDQICKIAEEIVVELGLIGSNGIDFVISGDDILVIEVNPRFQGTIEALEIATGDNIFHAHVKACRGEDFEIKKPRRYGMRAIFYAGEDLVIREDLRRWGFSDVPETGRRIEKGKPVVSVSGSSNSRRGVVEKINFFLSASQLLQ